MSRKDFLVDKLAWFQEKWTELRTKPFGDGTAQGNDSNRLNALRVKLDEMKLEIRSIDLQNWRESKGLIYIAQGAGVLLLVGAISAAAMTGTTSPVATAPTAAQAVTLAVKANGMVDACRIVVDGQPVMVVASRQEAEQMVKDAINFFSYGQIGQGVELIDVKVKQQIAYEDAEVPPEQVIPSDQAKKLLVEGKGEKIRYVVQKGDTLWSVATKNGMSWNELRKANAQLVNENKLKIGQEINLTRPVHYLNVVSTYKVVKEENVPYPTKVEKDTSLKVGAVKVKQEGVNGKKVATYIVSKENNYQFDEELKDEKTLQAPVQRIEARGDRVMVASRGGSSYSSAGASYSGGGSGTLSWPAGGRRITSPFGYRGREFHTGMDIDGETGDPVYSAADGVVTFAGWAGSYGKCILVDHGGVTTRYAHLSQLYVGEGQTVSRGANIGAIGATGRAYGSHLHFEVIDGGVKNPMAYLK
ncbi:peptidoglycan DD-metalloendopeptidase family protein [Heliobacterium gestii]|uniref:Peptidoglycan DD-metalloendopeptidase family protein n=1 Tax=Heliomicrobium gestii TaxID=2699 RepID=A0A845LI13_HELGE|nr:M23 family metallopeptidase [Heliomicrobium gestii]MBM7867817.1 murein DD-endopeptidase MepM/ murein hydrolase activator NlpD [Heliomicrobium gestii]MZP44209.1 peptidoglycan DD-metalloendopeptidase family protein [Heliomicrobium gestii]